MLIQATGDPRHGRCHAALVALVAITSSPHPFPSFRHCLHPSDIPAPGHRFRPPPPPRPTASRRSPKLPHVPRNLLARLLREGSAHPLRRPCFRGWAGAPVVPARIGNRPSSGRRHFTARAWCRSAAAHGTGRRGPSGAGTASRTPSHPSFVQPAKLTKGNGRRRAGFPPTTAPPPQRTATPLHRRSDRSPAAPATHASLSRHRLPAGRRLRRHHLPLGRPGPIGAARRLTLRHPFPRWHGKC